MNISLLARVRRHFVHGMAPRHVQRHNIKAWVKSVRHLGARWVLLQPIKKGTV